MRATKRHLVGRRIVDIDWNHFDTARPDHPATTDPRLILDNGREVYFIVAETDGGEYGVEIGVTAPGRAKRNRNE